MENKQRDKKKTRQVNEGLFVLAYSQMLKCSTLITNKGNQEGEFKLRSGILLIYWFLHLLGFMVLISHVHINYKPICDGKFTELFCVV